MSRMISIAVAEPSQIVRAGIVAILGQMAGLRLEVHEFADADKLRDHLSRRVPDILMVNPSLPGVPALKQLRKEAGEHDMKCIALQFAFCDPAALKAYDEVVSMYDSVQQVHDKIVRLASDPGGSTRPEPLSEREKEIVVCVVQGLTNKQIADKLFLSTHTVNTHRRNISAKLNIHSTAGLAIYAIVNKLVELSDVKPGE